MDFLRDLLNETLMTNHQKLVLAKMRKLLAKERFSNDASRNKVLLSSGIDVVESAFQTLKNAFGEPTENEFFLREIVWRHVMIEGERHDVFLSKTDGHELGQVWWL